ncbi:hypothetical protein J1N35_019537 [Gossypium stocksii]|uniref:Uncharacterized protein n=1 Tax=Gossypium stocksii TaxID=47602 RepID=A0A9D3VSK4_9ROSI|nr:hypothetical protein J1N35_019537 [Gossypium stocksii]
MLGGRNLSAVKENKERLAKSIDKCYNNFSFYQIQTGIDLMSKAQHLLQQNTYIFWTDGKRILAYNTGQPQKEKDKESVQLLKKDS